MMTRTETAADHEIAEVASLPVRVQSVSALRRRDWIGFAVLVVLWIGVNINFWIWWLRPENVESAWIYWPFTLALAYTGTVLTSFYLYFIGHMRRPVPVPPQPGLRVALITLCVPGHEGLEVIGRQLEALTRVEYPHDSWVLDEGNDPAVQALAKQHSVRYFSRAGIPEYNLPVPPFKAKTKAGNVNSWLDAHGSSYPIFVQFDIDHIPRQDYLDQVLGYFRDPDVAWVQAPSIYGNLSNWVARGSAEQELVLQGPLQMGFYGLSETPFIIGSHTTYRTEAVVEIGGFQPTRAEDHLDSLVLAAHGYRGVFVPEPIAVGAGPETFDTYIQQQFAWAVSLIQVLFAYAPRLVWQLDLKAASQFVFAESWYPLSSTALLVMSLVPVVALITHQQPANGALAPYLVRWIPVGAVATLIWVWSRPWRMPHGLGLSWRVAVLVVARWPIVLWALVNVILQVSHSYMITRKGSTGSDRRRAAERRRREMSDALAPVPDRRIRNTRRAAWQRRSRRREGVGRVSTVRSRSLYLVVVWCLGAAVLWFLTVDAWGLTGTSAADHQRVQGFALLIVWSMAFFGGVYAINVLSAVAELWRQSRRVGRLLHDYGLAIAVLVVTVGFWALLLNESVARLDETADIHFWPGRSLIPASIMPSPTPATAPIAEAQAGVAAGVAATATGVPTAVVLTDLPPRGVTAGAYDPSNSLAGLDLLVQHWFISQNEPEDLSGILSTARARQSVPLVTIEPFPSDGQTEPVLESIVNGEKDDQFVVLAQAAAAARPQLVLIRWAQEMDLALLYPWSTSQPDLYRSAYRRMVSIFRQQGADNVRWVWSPSGNTPAQEFYPGDDVVDYVGMTVLGDEQWDRLFGATSGQTFVQLLLAKYPMLAPYAKPMIIAELGVSGTPEHQRDWLTATAQALPQFPLIRVISYQNAPNATNNRMPSQPDWRISPSLFSGFESALQAIPPD